jgi:hypothetical protein
MTKPKGAERVAKLYALVERLRAVELKVAAGDVDEAACRIAMAIVHRETEVGNARDAIASGLRDEWHVAETTRKRLESRLRRLAELRAEREAVLGEAAARHRASQLNKDQIEGVLARQKHSAVVESGRRTQIESDDRFASREAWKRMKLGSGDR